VKARKCALTSPARFAFPADSGELHTRPMEMIGILPSRFLKICGATININPWIFARENLRQ
jgi:hypothetical protein